MPESSVLSSPQRHSPNAQRLSELDVLRGLAALAVVLFHYSVRFNEIYPTASVPAFQVSFGEYGVEFFFGISGFVIFMTLERTRRPMDFVVSRVARLWPAYLFAGALTFTAVNLVGLPDREVTLAQALLNITMVHEFLSVPSIDQVYWSLQVELIFYGWMFLAYLTDSLQRIGAWLWVALLPAIVYALAAKVFEIELSYTLGTLLLVKYSPFFIIGMAAYRIRAHGAVRVSDFALMAAAVATTAFCLTREQAFAAALASVVFLALSLGKLGWIARGPLLFLGAISYTLYLLHQNIGFIVMREVTSRGVDVNVAIAVALIVSVLLASALTFLIERPARDGIRNLYRKVRASRSPAAAAAELPTA